MTKENDFTLQELELIATQMPLISKNSDLMQKINAKIKNMTPRTIRIGEFDVPEPLRVAPDIGTAIFIPYMAERGKEYTYWIWSGDDMDVFKLKQGHVHLSKDAAILHTKALLSFTEKEKP